MIDFTALSALATSALMMHHPDKGADNPDCRHPAEIASDLVGIQVNGNGTDDASSFMLGFDFALRLGGLLATDPLRRPDLIGLIAEYEERVTQTYIDREPDYRKELATTR